MVEGEVDVTSRNDRTARVDARGEHGTLVVGEELPLVLLARLGRRPHRFGADARGVDREDRVRLGAQILDDVGPDPDARKVRVRRLAVIEVGWADAEDHLAALAGHG